MNSTSQRQPGSDIDHDRIGSDVAKLVEDVRSVHPVQEIKKPSEDAPSVAA
jgi:hypothetical protein